MSGLSQHDSGRAEPNFSRSDVARILNITPLTVANRERRKQYPDPKRDLNGWRVYTLNDVLNLQLLTYGAVDARPVLSLLYDKGYTSPKVASSLIDAAMARRKGLL